MKRFSFILTVAAFMLSVLPSCVYDHFDDIELPEATTVLKLHLSASVATRTAPSPGENGDYSEVGTENENRINNISLFFYRSDFGLNAHPDTEIIHTEYSSSINAVINQDTEITFEITDYKPRPGDRVIVAVNAGNITDCGKTIGEVAQHIVLNAWQDNERKSMCSSFVMANANSYDAQVVTSKNGTTLDGSQERPFYAQVEVERMAARIDFCFNNSNISDDALRYQARDANNNLVGNLYLTHIIPINPMQQGSWLLKHVTTTASTDFSCFNSLSICGDETVDLQGHADNYVVAPTTLIKNNGYVDFLSDWYGKYSVGSIRANVNNLLDNSTSVAQLLKDKFADKDYNYRFTPAYVNENTHHCSLQNDALNTGLLLKATYVPQRVYSDTGAETIDTDFQRGDSFWRYTPTNVSMSESKAIYFSNKEAAETYKSNHPDDLGEIQEFVNGICWYTVWLKHADCSDTSIRNNTPMEFGIVRNNVYKVGVAFTGPGRPSPDIDHPYDVVYRIFVRKWNFRQQSEIIM